MVDIAAQLSLIPSSPALDPGAILGAESADTEAFGNILATQVKGTAGTGAPASPLPSLPTFAAIRQPAGNILPGSARILPDAAFAPVEAPALQAATATATATAAQLVSAGLATKLAISVPQPGLLERPVDPASAEAAAAAIAQRAEASPVHGLLKMLAAAFKGQASAETAEPATDQEPAEGEPAEQSGDSTAASAPGELAAMVALPIVQIAATPQPTEAQSVQSADTARAAPILPTAMPAAATATSGQPAEAQAPTRSPAAEAQASSVLTVSSARVDGTSPAVTLEAAPIPVAGKAVTARIELAPSQTQADAPPVADRPGATPHLPRAAPGEVPVIAERAVTAARAAMTERAKQTEGAATEAAPAPLQPLAAESRAQTAGLPAAPGAAAPGSEMRQDFAALVERLIEARNAGAAQSSHASVRHAEFGQVSLQFQQEGRDLSVSMSSADPEFAVAVQAAMPADRQASADNASRNQQGQSQSQAQSTGNSAGSQQDAAGQRGEAGDQQGRNGRNPRGGANPGNPSQRWADSGQSQSRNGIFA